MSDKNNNNGKKDNQNYYLSVGIGIGLAFGAAFGVLFNNIAIGAGLGMLFGIVIGVLMDKNTKDVKRDVIKVVLVSIIGVILILLVPKVMDYLWWFNCYNIKSLFLILYMLFISKILREHTK